MKKTIGTLDLHRPQGKHETPNGARLQNTESVKEKLLAELVELEKQMENMKNNASSVDFSMLQTYKEMIYSRKSLFNELNRWAIIVRQPDDIAVMDSVAVRGGWI